MKTIEEERKILCLCWLKEIKRENPMEKTRKLQVGTHNNGYWEREPIEIEIWGKARDPISPFSLYLCRYNIYIIYMSMCWVRCINICFAVFNLSLLKSANSWKYYFYFKRKKKKTNFDRSSPRINKNNGEKKVLNLS